MSSSDLANRHSQPSQEHRYGFSPETQSGVRNLAEERERREEMPSQGGCLEKLNIKKEKGEMARLVEINALHGG